MNLITLVAGTSGSGKSYSMRNLGPETAVLNIERKMLPFQSKGLANAPIESTQRLHEAIERLHHNAAKRIVVMDSFSEWIDILLAECKNKAKGFDVWSLYNTEIFNLFQSLKSLKDKYVFIIGHTETLVDADGERIQRMKVKGKENEGMIEKNATCVFYSRTIRKPDGNGVDYRFITNTDGVLPAKTPFGMFPDLYIDNDLAAICHRYAEFYHTSATQQPEIPSAP